VAAGLAIEGMIPVFHTIAPFLVERALEQLKVDFGYQGLGGNFISVGASYDYSTLGCTHHCPGDVQALKTIPGMQIIVPGHPKEFDLAFRFEYANGKPTYFRLSERSNKEPFSGYTIKDGAKGTVVAIGPMRDRVIEACQDLDVSIIYYAVVEPLDPWPMARDVSKKIVIVEPFYEGTMLYDIQKAIGLAPSKIYSIGVPRRFITSYGTPEELDKKCGLTSSQIRTRIIEALNL
jgi:transketolase